MKTSGCAFSISSNEHHRVRAPPDLLGQEPAFFVADVAGRRAEQPGHGELLHVLRHVHADQRVLVAEQVLGQRTGQLGLAHAGRAEEHERAHRALGVLEAGARPADGAGDRLDGVVLADDPAVQRIFHAGQLLDSFSSSLASGMPVQRDTMNSMSTSPTCCTPLPLVRSHSRFISSSRCWRIFSFSRREAAFSNSCASRYMSFSRRTRSELLLDLLELRRAA